LHAGVWTVTLFQKMSIRDNRRDQLQGTLDLLVLRTLSSGGTMHGYQIMERIQLLSRDVLRVEAGSLYPALHRMEEAGWVRSEWATSDSNRRARFYAITAAGRRRLGEEEAHWAQLISAVGRVLRHA
jgi:PadR family transcriptional regulator